MKTIEEASLENSKNHYIMAFSEKLHMDADMDFRAGVEFAQRWIPVEEELPEMSGDCNDWSFEEDEPTKYSKTVFIKTSYGYTAGIVDELGSWFCDESLVGHEIITHWRPVTIT